jgi:hypothetical protein
MAGLVKHYQNDMQGIPQLTNAWGCMINLLDAVLITGFNFRPVLGLSKASTESLTATISLATGHGFIARQVVRIKDSTNGWNGDFKVLSITASSITVECLSSHPTTISGTAQVFTSPLDWEIVFSSGVGSAEPKRAYRSKSPDSLGLILLVHDFCVSGASSTGAKFAKVGLVSSMSDIDTITGNQIPYDNSAPNLNWGWDGTYHGWAKWYYKTSSATYAPDSSTPDAGNSTFVFVGTEVSFAQTILSPAITCGGVMQFEDVRYGGLNIALMASGAALKISQNTNVYPQARCALNMGIYPDSSPQYGGYTTKILFYYDESGSPIYEKAGRAIFLRAADGSTLDDLSVSGAQILIDQPLLTGANVVVGKLPFFKLGAFANNTLFLGTDGKVRTFSHNANSIFCKFAMTLEVE